MDRQGVERISKALGDKTRLLIFEAIHARGTMNCGEIVSLRGVTPATVSHHLRILAEAGLIECRRAGQFVQSRTNPKVLREYAKALTELVRKRKKQSARR
jgi:ArsR family transcriptional regulator, arsenate/arsenite/antimonite-responsive transcriptional repressor